MWWWQHPTKNTLEIPDTTLLRLRKLRKNYFARWSFHFASYALLSSSGTCQPLYGCDAVKLLHSRQRHLQISRSRKNICPLNRVAKGGDIGPFLHKLPPHMLNCCHFLSGEVVLWSAVQFEFSRNLFPAICLPWNGYLRLYNTLRVTYGRIVDVILSISGSSVILSL